MNEKIIANVCYDAGSRMGCQVSVAAAADNLRERKLRPPRKIPLKWEALALSTTFSDDVTVTVIEIPIA